MSISDRHNLTQKRKKGCLVSFQTVTVLLTESTPVNTTNGIPPKEVAVANARRRLMKQVTHYKRNMYYRIKPSIRNQLFLVTG